MALPECTQLHGNTTLHEHDPACQTYRDVLYMPTKGQKPAKGYSYGLYRQDGSLIRAAGRFRGPNGELAGPQLRTNQDVQRVRTEPYAGPLLYMGVFVTHYGHFLLDTLCRLWALKTVSRTNLKIVYHDDRAPDVFFQEPFIAAILGALGLSKNDFIKFDEPCVLPEIIIPEPAIEELNYAHRCYGQLLNEIGEAICPASLATARSDKPIYLTKMKVAHGVSHFVNEAEFVRRLEMHGMDIFIPEEHTLQEQIGIFRTRRTVTGLIGSALHTSGFVPGREVLALTYRNMLWTNQVLIDQANDARSTFVYEPDGCKNEGTSETFGNNFRIANPTRLADEFMRTVDDFQVKNQASNPVSVNQKNRPCAVVAVVKNEERHIAEWIAYQYAIGFDTVVLMDNGSTDGTIQQALHFVEHHDLRIFDWHLTTPDYQTRACERAAQILSSGFDWVAFFDADEFLVLEEESLKSCLARHAATAAIGVSWSMFGSSGVREATTNLTIETYTRRSDAAFPPNRHVKSIVRPERVKSCPTPHMFTVDGAYKDLVGREIVWEAPGIMSGPPDYRGGKLHHYFTRSWSDWQAKLKRGYHDIKRKPSEFEDYDRNEVADESALRHAPAVRSILQQAGLIPNETSSAPAAAQAPVPARHQYALVACARWEAPYIAEWITYHRWLGFDHVYLYCNEDDPAELYEKVLPFAVGPVPFVTFYHYAPQGRQAEMYRHFLRTHKAETEWFMFLDIDEFLVLKRTKTIQEFMSRFLSTADQVLFNWLPYGTSWHDEPAAGSVLLNYTWREADFHPLTKYIVRAGAIPEIVEHGSFWHDFGPKINASLRMVNPIGLDMGHYDFANGRENVAAYAVNPATGETLIDTAYIAHFGFKSRSAFLRRALRGLQGDFAGQTMWTDLYNSPIFEAHLRRVNGVQDLSLKTLWQSVLEQGRKSPPGLDPPAPTYDLSYSVNPFGKHGFVIGWETARLGKRLSTFANLFALHHRTGVTVMYPQIMSAGSVIDAQSDPLIYMEGELPTGTSAQREALVEAMDRVFANGDEGYEKAYHTLPLEWLPNQLGRTGIVIYSRYQPSFRDMRAHETNIKTFCAGGNGIILAGAFWQQYLDMRELEDCGRRLKQKLRINREDQSGQRALAMRAAGEATLRIGIHMRRGAEYKVWHDGKYHFQLEQYLAVMHHIHQSLGERPHCFYVCSDEAVDRDMLRGLPVWYERGGFEDDFVALSKCHYVVGPPSTFGTWSAFLGGAKRVVLTPERLADLSSPPPLLAGAVDVIYPTGGYMPGDPAARPI